MKQILTQKEIEKIQDLCFKYPDKSCAITQLFIDTLQIMSCATFAEIQNKSHRTIQYQAKNMTGIKIENRKFVSLIQ